MVTFPNEKKILDWDEKSQTNKKKYSLSVKLCIFEAFKIRIAQRKKHVSDQYVSIN